MPAADANDAVLQDMTDAETGLRGWVATDDETFLEPYRRGRTQAIRDQLRLQQYAEQHPDVRRAVARQAAAVEDWFASYAEPRLDLPAGPASVSHQRFLVGKQKFDRVRAANAAVGAKLSAALEESRATAARELPWIVGILVFVAVLGAVASLFARRVAGRITQPLVEMQRTVDRLAAGDTEARTTVSGPREVRRVGEALNNFADQNARLLVLERQAVERLENLDRAKSDFVSNVSHELRTPLTSIAGYVELFEDGFLGPAEPPAAEHAAGGEPQRRSGSRPSSRTCSPSPRSSPRPSGPRSTCSTSTTSSPTPSTTSARARSCAASRSGRPSRPSRW